jgi:kynurenine formamidase
MEYLASRGVMTLGTDSPSMGPLPDLAEPTHFAGLRHGMIWTEGATGLGKLPTTGAFYCMLGPRYAGGIGGSVRAFAITQSPLAGKLIEAARKKQVVDLSVVLSPDLPVWWPGTGAGDARHAFESNLIEKFAQNAHVMDSHTGTHLVPPAYALPPPGFDNKQYAPEVGEWLAEYEQKYGPRETSDVTAEKASLSLTCGPVRVIDVSHLVGTTDKKSWPASPEIRPDDIKKYEREHGSLRPGNIVIFKSGYSDRTFKPFPEGNACLTDPLAGKSEGWPAPGPDAILYLADRAIGCVGIDGPTLGGVEPKRALMTYWALAGEGMVSVDRTRLTSCSRPCGSTNVTAARAARLRCTSAPDCYDASSERFLKSSSASGLARASMFFTGRPWITSRTAFSTSLPLSVRGMSAT